MRLALAALLLVACKRDVTEEVKNLEKRACECAAKKDKTCGTAVLGDLAKLREAKNVKADEREAAESAKKLAACLLESGVTAVQIHEQVNKQDQPEAPAE